jgi:HEAT repeat protein
MLARALLVAARTRAMYPRDHPAVQVAVVRLSEAIAAGTSGVECSIGVTPDTLLVKGEPLPPSQSVSETAQFLHDRDVLRLDFAPGVSTNSLQDLLELLCLDPNEVRERGGPAAAWAHSGHPSISLEQIDYRRILEDRDVPPDAPRRDDVWVSIVKSIVHGEMTFDEVAQQRLLDIARDAGLIGELAREAMAQKHAADGSPMVASQAVTIVAAFRHLAGIVNVMDPDHVPEVMRNLADATTGLDPNVVMRVLQCEDDPQDSVHVVKGLIKAFDDTKVASLLAATLAAEGRATGRLANVLSTIAPERERRQRVMRLTRDMLVETDFGKSSQFKALWTSMESLVLSHDVKPYVSSGYGTSLDGAESRAETLGFRELPPEFRNWVGTLEQQNIRHLSVTMMIDLLRLEDDAERGTGLTKDLQILAEDLLLSGEIDHAARVTEALAECSASETSVTQPTCRRVLDELARSTALLETVEVVGELESAQFDAFSALCRHVGPEAVEALSVPMFREAVSLDQQRVGDIIVAYGVGAVLRLAPLVNDERWFVQMNGVTLLSRIAAPEAVPLLQPLLRKGDPRLTPTVVSALAGINDPAAARAIHTVLRTATGDLRRAVIGALLQERDPRVVPILERILHESEPFGRDHAIVLETMDALATLAGDRAVPPIVTLIRRRRWLARRKNRALKRTGVNLLLRVGSPAASRALDEGRTHGDRLLRRIIRDAQRSGDIRS